MKSWSVLVAAVLLAFTVGTTAAQPIVDDFRASLDEQGMIVPPESYTSGWELMGQYWFYYPFTDWWNAWFFDHPLDFTRGKMIWIEFLLMARDPVAAGVATVTINWSTGEWPSGNDPPIPDAIPTPGDELLWIGREIVLEDYVVTEPMTFAFGPFCIREYNPEWVSVDVRGFNVIIEGQIIHECVEHPSDVDATTWGRIRQLF
jgi:hypothetical protein